MSGKIDPECLNSRHILINLEVKNDKKKRRERNGEGGGGGWKHPSGLQAKIPTHLKKEGN